MVRLRHIGGTLNVYNDGLNYGNLKILMPINYFAHRVFRLVCNTKHDSLKAYVRLRRRTTTITIPPTWRRSLL